MIETPQDVLQDYERRPRALTPDFVANLPWNEVRRHALNPRFVPVLIYMRDVEKFTEVYFEELQKTPTGKEPVIRRFMERWNAEEAQHGDLLNRFLNEAGIPSEDRWYERVKTEIPLRYKVETSFYTSITKLFGKSFSAAHMVWGAINELTTLQGYRRLIQLSEHPVLTQLLRGIMQEESMHISFYFNIAKLKLARSKFSRSLARWIIKKFWGPVGKGIRPFRETEYVIRTLFQGDQGMKCISEHVDGRVELLPGFSGVKTVTEKINELFQKPFALVSA